MQMQVQTQIYTEIPNKNCAKNGRKKTKGYQVRDLFATNKLDNLMVAHLNTNTSGNTNTIKIQIQYKHKYKQRYEKLT